MSSLGFSLRLGWALAGAGYAGHSGAGGGLSSRQYLTDRIALLKLSEEAREALTEFPKVVEYRVRARMYGEDEETVTELAQETFERSKITMMHLRPISTLPEDRQMQVINTMLDSFIEGGTASKRHVEAMVKAIRTA